MSEELPDGWVATNFSAIVTDAQNGFSPRAGSGTPTVVLRLADVSPDGTVASSGLRRIGLSGSDRTKYGLKAGDLLAFRVNGSPSIVGRVIEYAGSAGVAYCDHFIRFRVDPSAVLPKFIALAFQHKTVRAQVEARMVSSAGQNTVSQASLREVEIPLAPLAEQRRIVAKIEALLAQVNAARERLAKVPLILKRFRQAVLAAACSGKLTEDWRQGDPDVDSASHLIDRLRTLHEPFGTGRRGNAAAPTEEAHDLEASDLPPSWAACELMWLCEPGRPITYGILKPGPHQPRGIPYVRVADFPDDTLTLDGMRKTTEEIAHAYRRSTLRAGDVLLSIRGTYGRVCRVPRELEGGNITQDTARLTIDASVSPDYIATYLRSPLVQDRLRRAAKGVAVHGVNIGDVRAIQVALPPRDEQEEIVRRVESLLTVADAIERAVVAARGRAARIPQAILSKAFAGELVPTEADLARAEGRAYEPASALIDRIRAAGDQLAKAAGKRRRSGRSPARPTQPSGRAQPRQVSMRPE